MRIILTVIILLGSGCTTMGESKSAPTDWPKMEIIEHPLGFFNLQGRCYKYLSTTMKLVGGLPLACAEAEFDKKRCHIWYYDLMPGLVEHERMHCKGLDHQGDDVALKAWEAHKANKKKI